MSEKSQMRRQFGWYLWLIATKINSMQSIGLRIAKYTLFVGKEAVRPVNEIDRVFLSMALRMKIEVFRIPRIYKIVLVNNPFSG
jgi:hypothetical protein